MNTIADGEREKFEAWLKDRPHMGFAGYAWKGWQASIAARQPVGQEPVAHRLVTGDPKRKWICVQGPPSDGVIRQAKDHGWEIELLYASPPADLRTKVGDEE